MIVIATIASLTDSNVLLIVIVSVVTIIISIMLITITMIVPSRGRAVYD